MNVSSLAFSPAQTMGHACQIAAVLANLPVHSLVSECGLWEACLWVAPVKSLLCGLEESSTTDVADLVARVHTADAQTVRCAPGASPDFAMSRRHRCTCGTQLRPDTAAATQATVVGCARARKCWHIPLRCGARLCRRRWSSTYSVHGGKHIVDEYVSQAPVFFTSATQAFDVEYLEQFHKRVMRMHATFCGEADVQNCCRKALSKAYTLWQLCQALAEIRAAQPATPGAEPLEVDLSLPVEEQLNKYWPAYCNHWHQKWCAQLPQQMRMIATPNRLAELTQNILIMLILLIIGPGLYG